LDIYWNILKMHGPINVKSPNNTSKWQIGFNSAFKELPSKYISLRSSNYGKRDGRCMLHVGRRKTNIYRVLLRELRGKSRLEKPRCRWEENTQRILREQRWGEKPILDSSCSGEGQMTGCCECGNETLGSIKCGNNS
jgi:hypothetical protein